MWGAAVNLVGEGNRNKSEPAGSPTKNAKRKRQELCPAIHGNVRLVAVV
jgi:hypothetical protein